MHSILFSSEGGGGLQTNKFRVTAKFVSIETYLDLIRYCVKKLYDVSLLWSPIVRVKLHSQIGTALDRLFFFELESTRRVGKINFTVGRIQSYLRTQVLSWKTEGGKLALLEKGSFAYFWGRGLKIIFLSNSLVGVESIKKQSEKEPFLANLCPSLLLFYV